MRLVPLLFAAAVTVMTTLATAATKEAGTTPMAADNPFAHVSKLPFEMPPFDRIRDADYTPAFEEGMREQLKEVAAIAHDAKPATVDGAVVVDKIADLDGLTPLQIGAAAQAAADRGLKDKWVIALQNTTNQPILASLSNRELRERIYRASVGRG